MEPTRQPECKPRRAISRLELTAGRNSFNIEGAYENHGCKKREVHLELELLRTVSKPRDVRRRLAVVAGVRACKYPFIYSGCVGARTR